MKNNPNKSPIFIFMDSGIEIEMPGIIGELISCKFAVIINITIIPINNKEQDTINCFVFIINYSLLNKKTSSFPPLSCNSTETF